MQEMDSACENRVAPIKGVVVFLFLGDRTFLVPRLGIPKVTGSWLDFFLQPSCKLNSSLWQKIFECFIL